MKRLALRFLYRLRDDLDRTPIPLFLFLVLAGGAVGHDYGRIEAAAEIIQDCQRHGASAQGEVHLLCQVVRGDPQP